MSHLSRGKLANVAQVAAGSTSAVVTVAGNNNVYVKSIIIHDGSNIGSVGVANTAHVYFVPNNAEGVFPFKYEAETVGLLHVKDGKIFKSQSSRNWKIALYWINVIRDVSGEGGKMIISMYHQILIRL